MVTVAASVRIRIVLSVTGLTVLVSIRSILPSPLATIGVLPIAFGAARAQTPVPGDSQLEKERARIGRIDIRVEACSKTNRTAVRTKWATVRMCGR